MDKLNMQGHSRIYIAGHRGLVGSSVVRALQEKGYNNLLTKSHKELDLTQQASVEKFSPDEKPEYVILAAAKVGGIWANNEYPAEFIYENLMIQNNVINQAYQHGVKRLIFLGSSCIYPRECPQPIKEEYLMTGPLEITNRPYATAKIAGIEMCSAYNRQYGTEFIAAMPTNLYGPGDNYHPDNSHVIPALIRKIHDAKEKGQNKVTLWGTGAPRREFLFSEDCANAVVFLMELESSKFNQCITEGKYPLINIGVGDDLTILDLAQMLARVIGFEGDFEFDLSKPDGTLRKLLDVNKLNDMGWGPRMSLERGLVIAYRDFKKRYALQDTNCML